MLKLIFALFMLFGTQSAAFAQYENLIDPFKNTRKAIADHEYQQIKAKEENEESGKTIVGVLLLLIVFIAVRLWFNERRKDNELSRNPNREGTSTIGKNSSDRYCENCGKSLQPSFRFCSWCGANQEVDSVQTPSGAPVTPKIPGSTTDLTTSDAVPGTGWIKELCGNYANFSGRTARSAYWWTFFATALTFTGLGIVDIYAGTTIGGTGWGLFSGLFAIAVLVPWLALNVRRLHDSGLSGWWILLNFIPYIGFIVVVALQTRPSAPNK